MSMRHIRLLAGAVVCAAALWIFWPQAALIIRVTALGAVIAAIVAPLASRASKRLPRPFAAALAVGAVFALLGGLTALLLPTVIAQAGELAGRIPQIRETLSGALDKVNARVASWGVPEIKLDAQTLTGALGNAGSWLDGAASYAGAVTQRFAEVGMSVLIAYYLLRDAPRVSLVCELMLPSASRRLALHMLGAVKSELGAYLKGQLLISLAVGAIACVLLLAAGVRGFLVLGIIVGVFNLIPYFGPIIGGVPAMLVALTQGLDTALWCLGALFLVQQIDGFLISPRLMGESTGVHPAFVLLALAAGGSLAGVAGMLFAMPALLSARAVYRVWALRAEIA